MTNAMGFGPPDRITTYFDMTAGKTWVSTADEWVELGSTPPPPPVDPPDNPPPPPPVDPPPAPPVGLKAFLTFLTSEMSEPHEGSLDGVPPGYDWAGGPRLGGGNDRGGNQAATAWAQIYTSGGQIMPAGTVEIRNLTLACLTGGRWDVIQQTRPAGQGHNGGGYFRADFVGNATAPGQGPRQGDGGSIVGEPIFGYNLHTWGDPRATLPERFDALCVWFEARVLHPGANVFLAGAGGDYYTSLDSNPPNGDFAIGRLRRLTGRWSTHATHTMTADQINSGTLPPIVLTGGGTTPTPTPDPPADTPVRWRPPQGRDTRVMFVGDSITVMQAEDPQGLATFDSRVPFDVDLVGSQTTGNGVRHEGHGAWCADDSGGRCVHTNGYHAGGIIQNIGGWVTAHRPDVVILNCGQNDRYVRDAYSPAQIGAAVGLVVDAVHDVNRTVMVLVTTYGRDNIDVNRHIENELGPRARRGRAVRTFDAYRGFVDADWQGTGNIHPSPAGVSKMVNAAASALTVLASEFS